ncbi:hypothetical protein AAHE18_08G164300 [Arachis hypogaea]
MRFLLDFVYCCGTSNLRSEDSGYSTKPLVPPPSQNFRRKKRGAPDWRPSLGSISEDGAAATRERGGPGAGRDVRRRSGGGAAVAPAVRFSGVITVTMEIMITDETPCPRLCQHSLQRHSCSDGQFINNCIYCIEKYILIYMV